MGEFAFYNYVEGSQILMQYYGLPYEIISVVILVVDTPALGVDRWRNMPLNIIRGTPLNMLRDERFTEGVGDVIAVFTPFNIVANINGVASVIVPSDGLPAGISLLAQAQTLGSTAL